MEVSKILGSAGGGELVTASDGKEWRLSPCTKRVQSYFEAWLKSRVRAGAVSQKETLAEEDYIQLLSTVEENIALDRYSWGGLPCRKALIQPTGLVELLRLLLELHHGKERLKTADVEKLLEADGEQFGSAIRTILGLPHPKAEEPAPDVMEQLAEMTGETSSVIVKLPQS